VVKNKTSNTQGTREVRLASGSSGRRRVAILVWDLFSPAVEFAAQLETSDVALQTHLLREQIHERVILEIRAMGKSRQADGYCATRKHHTGQGTISKVPWDIRCLVGQAPSAFSPPGNESRHTTQDHSESEQCRYTETVLAVPHWYSNS
jgi:hypothetical protein